MKTPLASGTTVVACVAVAVTFWPPHVSGAKRIVRCQGVPDTRSASRHQPAVAPTDTLRPTHVWNWEIGITGLQESTTTSPRESLASCRPSVIIATDGLGPIEWRAGRGTATRRRRPCARGHTVVKPWSMVSPEMGLPLSSEVETARRADQKRVVEQQAARVWGTNAVDVVLSEAMQRRRSRNTHLSRRPR